MADYRFTGLADSGLKPCCSGRKHFDACCKHPLDHGSSGRARSCEPV